MVPATSLSRADEGIGVACWPFASSCGNAAVQLVSTEVDIEPRSQNWLYGTCPSTNSVHDANVHRSIAFGAPKRSPKSFQFKRKAEQCE